MDKFDFDKAAHDLAVICVRNNIKNPEDIDSRITLYLNAFHQCRGRLTRELSQNPESSV